MKQNEASWEPTPCESLQVDLPRLGDKQLDEKLQEKLLAQADIRRTDMRIELGLPYRDKGWPRMAVAPDRWRWKPVVSFPLRMHHLHINALEMKALTTGVRYMVKTNSANLHRLFVLCDAQVRIAIICKGRSSSKQMKLQLRKLAALCLAQACASRWGM